MKTAPSDNALPLGPDNWFDAWWVSLQGRKTHTLAAGPDDRPSFSRVPLEELRFVENLLGRIYYQVGSEASPAETAFLNRLLQLFLERAAEEREQGEPDPAGVVHITLPPPEHPLYAPDFIDHVVDEMWRITGEESHLSHLEGIVATSRFVKEATRCTGLRRFAIALARQKPSTATYNALRAIYRDPALASRVCAQDRKYLSKGAKGRELKAAIDALGLHAPLERPPLEGRALTVGPPGDAPTAPPPQVTVLIPSYNHGTFIARTLESVLGQEGVALRVLVADDRSPDDTVARAEAVGDPRVEVRVNDRNLGLGESVCQALDHVETEYTALLNSDDLLLQGHLASCLESLEANDRIDLVATRVVAIDDQERILHADNCSAVDCGPMAFRWLQWYRDLAAELRSEEEWSSFIKLLQANHLLTSSNLVCRTDYLKRMKPRFRNLKYCVDWALFLEAALEEKLAVIPRELVAYRLHQENTIWFEESHRPGFLLEENLVAAGMVRRFADRLLVREGREGALLQLTALFNETLSKNQDLGGLALFLQSLLGFVPDLDPKEPQQKVILDALAEFLENSQDRMRLKRILDRTPHSIADLEKLIWEKEQIGADRHVAEGYLENSRNLEKKMLWLQQELDRAGNRLNEADVELNRLKEERRSLYDKIDATWQEKEKAREDWEQANRLLAEERARGQETRERLGKELERIQRRLDALWEEKEKVREDWEQANRQLTEERARCADLTEEGSKLQERLEALLEQEEETRKSLEHLAETLRGKTEEWTTTRTRLDAMVDELNDRLEWTLGAWREERLGWYRENHRLRTGVPERLRMKVLERLRLAAPVAAVARLRRDSGRLLGRAWNRLPFTAGPATDRVAVLAPPGRPRRARSLAAREARALEDAGLTARLFYLDTVAGAIRPAPGAGHLVRPEKVLLDPSLQARDLDHYRRRHPERVADLAGTLDAATLARGASLARALAGSDCRLVLAGFDDDSIPLCRIATHLLRIPWCLVCQTSHLVGATDIHLGDLPATPGRIVVDCEETAATLRMIGEIPDGVCRTRPPVVTSQDHPAERRPTPNLVAAVGTLGGAWDLDLLLHATADLIAGGSGVRLEVLYAIGDEEAALDQLYWVRRRITELDLADRVTLVELDEARRSVDLMARATVLATVTRDSREVEDHSAPMPLLAAMAAGMPIVATDEGFQSRAIRDQGEGLLVPPGDRSALAAAIARLLEDGALAGRLAGAARARYREHFAVPTMGRDLYDELRTLMGKETPAGS